MQTATTNKTTKTPVSKITTTLKKMAVETTLEMSRVTNVSQTRT